MKKATELQRTDEINRRRYLSHLERAINPMQYAMMDLLGDVHISPGLTIPELKTDPAKQRSENETA